jgi:hypothetical protein
VHIKKLLNSRVVAVAAGATIVGLVGAGAGWSAAQITSADIANDTILSKDVHDGTLKTEDFKDKTVDELKGDRGPQGPAGPIGPQGPAGNGATYSGPHWSIVDRNVEENGDSYLRSGPGTPPKGVGSLGLRTGGAQDKAAFGNQQDFAGLALSTLTTLKYSIYTTGENMGNGADNGPSLSIEVDPSGTMNTPGLNFSTLVFVPENLVANAWTLEDASTAKRWFFTGTAGAESNCNQATYCTLAEAKAAFGDATLSTVQITKGRDFEFSGAVDALVVNNKTYDFEPFGVSESAS